MQTFGYTLFLNHQQQICMQLIQACQDGAQSPPSALQGRRVTGEGVRAHHSYEDFNAYDINLYSEDSDCSSSGFLQPVPSLPGLAEPPLQGGAAVLKQAAGSSTLKLKKQDAGTVISSSSALSPTKHQAWRQKHMQRVPGECMTPSMYAAQQLIC
jgi:hypothetical protein